MTWNYSQTSATNRTSEGKLWRFVLSLDKTWRTRPSIVLWRGPPSKTWRPTPMQTIRIYSKKNATWRKPCVKVCYPSDVALVKHFIYIVYTEKTCSLIVLCEQGWRATGRITWQWPRISVLMKSSKKRWRTFLWPASGRWVSSCSPIQLSSLLQRMIFSLSDPHCNCFSPASEIHLFLLLSCCICFHLASFLSASEISAAASIKYVK